MKKLSVILFVLLFVAGCNVGPLDLTNSGGGKSQEEIKEEGNPFIMYEHEGKNIPILADALSMDEDYYAVQKIFAGEHGYENIPEEGECEIMPMRYILQCNASTQTYGHGGEPEKHERLVVYVDVKIDGQDRESQFEGYKKNSGNLFNEGWQIDIESKGFSRETFYKNYCIAGNEAAVGLDWGYLSDGHDPEYFWEFFLFDANSKKLIEKEVFMDNTSRYGESNDFGEPEYRFDVVKDRAQIMNDLNSMYCLDTNEHFQQGEDDMYYGFLSSDTMTLERIRTLEFGFMEDPVSLYVEPEVAYLRDFSLMIRGDERTLSKDDEVYHFDKEWRLSQFENSEINVSYVYGEGYVDMEVKDLASGAAETVRYEFSETGE